MGEEEPVDDGPTEASAAPREHDPTARTVVEKKPETGTKTERAAASVISLGALSGTGPRTTRSEVLATPAEATRLEEVRRTRSFAIIAAAFAVLVLLVILLLNGDPTAKLVFSITLALVLVSSLALLYAMRVDEGYSVERALAFGVLCIGTAFGSIYYFGVFSPAAVVVPFGLYSFSVGQSYRSTLGVYALCAGLELAIGLPTAFGWIADRGILRGDGLDTATRVIVILLVESVFFATFLIARASRAAWIHAIEQHDRAVRGLVTREELLREAKQELARALEVGNLGRFTDDTIGKYRLGNILGRGGMGEVYDAVHIDTAEPAAVKLLHHHAVAEPANVRRFLREAKIVASLEVPNVVRVLEASGLDDGLPFIAMERLRGQDLSELLREQRRLSMPKVQKLLREVGAGLEAAREKGIVHRDIKPRNLFLAEQGEPSSGSGRHRADNAIWKILDFGVSRITSDQATLTGEQMLGTPTYMAPEQISASSEVDHRADLYALGVIAYRALTGRPAFSGDQMAEILFKVLNDMPLRPSASVKLHPDVDDVLAIAMAKRASDRFESARDFVQAMDAAAEGQLPGALRLRALRLANEHPWSEA